LSLRPAHADSVVGILDRHGAGLRRDFLQRLPVKTLCCFGRTQSPLLDLPKGLVPTASAASVAEGIDDPHNDERIELGPAPWPLARTLETGVIAKAAHCIAHPRRYAHLSADHLAGYVDRVSGTPTLEKQEEVATI